MRPAARAAVLALSSVLSDPGKIVPVGNTSVPRFSHTATLLRNGKVLIAGGMSRGSTTQPTAELYDPTTRQFTHVGNLTSPRGYGATATLLDDGKVLIAGGSCGAGCVLSSAELFDPATETFAATGSMSARRAAACAVRLQDGDVLIMGGDSDPDRPPLATADLYHPATGKFSTTGSMTTPRDYFAAVLGKDGKVLVMGGSSTGQHASGMTEESSAELYDPSIGRFTRTGAMSVPRNKLGAVLLPNGGVLVVGGQNSGAFGHRLASTEIYHPRTGEFKAGPNMHSRRYKMPGGLVTLKDGRVLVGGGAEQPEIYDPASNVFTTVAGPGLDAFYYSTVTLLASGDALIAGGYGSQPSVGAINHAWLYRDQD